MEGKQYPRLGVMMALSFLSMYVLTYAMVDRAENVYPNLREIAEMKRLIDSGT